ncbi:MAG: OmpA family protein [Rhodospirillales bacterium]|nr:OmpA family protein [Rhodospirillales bacterium]MBO6787005.1 OmpA family protein [Rhodospirillales bacterium]
MAAPKSQPPEENTEDWLTTFADAITLLMAFFVMLLTFAEFDIPAYEELTSAVAANIGGRDKQTTTQSLKIDAQDLVYEMQADQVVTVGTDEKGVVIELQSNAFFKPGSAEIVQAAIPVLKKLSETLALPNYELYNVVVEGHTDDGQISTQQFPSNWELSAGRAASVVRLFEANDVDRSRLKATGYADTRPKVPNRDLEGKPIPENRATNRRVVLRLHPMSLDERDAYIRAQEFKRRQEEAKAVAPQGDGNAAAPVSVEERLPIQPAPQALNPDEQQTKSALDALKREIHAAGLPADINTLEEWQLKFDNLSSKRTEALAKDFEQITAFLNQERQRLSQPAN